MTASKGSWRCTAQGVGSVTPGMRRSVRVGAGQCGPQGRPEAGQAAKVARPVGGAYQGAADGPVGENL